VLLAIGFVWWRTDARHDSSCTRSIDSAVADSTRYASTIALMSAARRQDTITQRMTVIRGIDERRYVWPRILNEISHSLPAYTWLTRVTSADDPEGDGWTRRSRSRVRRLHAGADALHEEPRALALRARRHAGDHRAGEQRRAAPSALHARGALREARLLDDPDHTGRGPPTNMAIPSFGPAAAEKVLLGVMLLGLAVYAGVHDTAQAARRGDRALESRLERLQVQPRRCARCRAAA
jgi:hypothetical protein